MDKSSLVWYDLTLALPDPISRQSPVRYLDRSDYNLLQVYTNESVHGGLKY